MQHAYFLNVWQELFEAFSKGASGVQTWGLTAGIIIFALLLLRPLLKYVEDNPATPSSATYTVPLPEAYRLVAIIKSLKSSGNDSVKAFYQLRYGKAVNYLLFFTNFDLQQTDMDAFSKFFVEVKATAGYVVCKKTAPDVALFRKTLIKLRKECKPNNGGARDWITIYSIEEIEVPKLLPFKLESDIVLTKFHYEAATGDQAIKVKKDARS